MKVEGYLCNIDELDIGFHMNYGQDENGEFHSVTIGLLIFAISFYRYL